MNLLKKILLAIWNWYDMEPSPEAIARKKAYEAEYNARQAEYRPSNESERAIAQFFLLVLLVVAAGFATWCYNNINIKSHIPVSVTVEYR